jgi:hypothetical protein
VCQLTTEWAAFDTPPPFPWPLQPFPPPLLAPDIVHHQNMGFSSDSALTPSLGMTGFTSDFASNLQHAPQNIGDHSFKLRDLHPGWDSPSLTILIIVQRAKAHRQIHLNQEYGHVMNPVVSWPPSLDPSWADGTLCSHWRDRQESPPFLDPTDASNTQVSSGLHERTQCTFQECAGTFFRRKVDLRRHLQTVHSRAAL